MGHIRTRLENGCLYFDFQYQKIRCREQTLLPDTPANRKKLEGVLKRIEAEILLGSFEYARYFPKSPMLDKLARLDKQQSLAASLKKATPTFEAFAELWFEEMLPSWRSATAEGYRFYLDKRLVPFFGQMDVSEISKADIMQFRSEATKLKDGTLKAKTVNKYIKLLKMILTEAADRYHFTPSHLNIKSLKEEKVHIEPFSLTEVNLMINQVRPDWRAYLIVRFFTGLRSGEIDGLKWENVDFERRQILVRETFSRGEFQTTKNDGSQREVEMSNLVYDALLQRLGSQKPTGLVFSSRDGSPINNPNFLNRVWRPLLALLNIPYRRPYQTRHTAATLWLAAGENPTWIAKQMGHSNTEMLFKVYSRYIPNLTRQDGSAMERLMAQNITLNLPKSAQPMTSVENLDPVTEQSQFWDQFIAPVNPSQTGRHS